MCIDLRFADDDDEEEEAGGKMQEIHDETETDLVNLRRTIYLTIQSSMQADEAAHKLMKLQVKGSFHHQMPTCC